MGFEMCLASRTFWIKCPVQWASCITLQFRQYKSAERQNSISFTKTSSLLFLRKLSFLGLRSKEKAAPKMCWTGIWIPPCRSTKFNFWTCGFWSRVRICSQAHVYPAWSKVLALLMLARCEIPLICCDRARGWLADDVLEVQSAPVRRIVLPSVGAPTTSKPFLPPFHSGTSPIKNSELLQ